MLSLDDTIAAIASAAGGGARGIVRLSGPSVAECLENLLQAEDVEDGRLWATRSASRSEPANAIQQKLLGKGHVEGGAADSLRESATTATAGSELHTAGSPTAWDGSIVLTDLAATLPCQVLYWPTARSYTRQPAAEIHTLGSPPLLEALLRAVCAAGARLAAPGEFTLRAFLAGRIDLTQAEAVLGVIDAADERALQAALKQLAGGLAGPLRLLREELLDLLARLEAGLDFVDEDIEFISAAEIEAAVDAAAAQVRQLAARLTERGDATTPFTAVLTGWPNVGKSSLFNALAGAARAIVSPLPGATRDYLTADLDLAGVAVRLVDTAGAEPDAVGGLTGAAQQARDDALEQAHLEVLCLDATRSLNAWERGQLEGVAPQRPRLVARTKCDAAAAAGCPDAAALETSAATGAGLEALRSALREAAVSRSAETDVGAVTSARCGESLRLAAECLARAAELARERAGHELLAAELRVALDELGKVAGAVYTEDLLDRIFSRFCIGK